VADRRGLNLGVTVWQALREFAALRLVAEMIGDRVASDPVEAAGEGPPTSLVAADIAERLDENLGRYVFGSRRVMEACEDVSVDTRHVPVVENAKGIRVDLRPLDETLLFLVHSRSLWREPDDIVTEFTDCEGADR